jgi:phosphate transport system substrate-binding protein
MPFPGGDCLVCALCQGTRIVIWRDNDGSALRPVQDGVSQPIAGALTRSSPDNGKDDVSANYPKLPKVLPMKHSRLQRMAAVTMVAATAAFSGTPVQAAESLMIQGSSTVSARLLTPFKDAIEAKSGQKLDVNASKSAPGLVALLEGKADIAMTSAPLDAEMAAVRQLMPSADMMLLTSTEVGKTRVAFALNANNTVKTATLDQVRDILTGKLTNWKELGGPDLPIRVVAVRLGGGLQTTVEGQLLDGKPIDGAHVIKVNNGSQIIKVVEQEPGALGIAQLGLVTEAKLPELVTNKQIEQRLFLVTRSKPSEPVQRVIAAAQQVAAQELR